METKIFTKSENFSQEYCATVVRLGEIFEIPNANTVAKTVVNGRTIVIGKDHKEGDLMIYCSNESQLNFDFLSVNNLFEDFTLNCNCDEVQQWLIDHPEATADEQKEYMRIHRGYFDKKGRVRMKKLAGELSMGVLFELSTFKQWCPNLNVNLEELVGTDFDMVNDVLFIKPYVPEVKQGTPRVSKDTRRNRKLAKFDRMIPGQFAFHYDTQLFERNVHRISPEMVVTISNKLHGTSYIIGNVLVKRPKWEGLYRKLFVYLPKWLQFTNEGYDIVYSSRSIIKNQFINPKKGPGYSAGLDKCFDKYYELLKPYVPEGTILYGEIIGYVEGSNSYIQTVGQGYDYRLKPGQNQLMIYRVSQMIDGVKKDMNVLDVLQYTLDLKKRIEEDGHPEIAERLHPIDVFYHGTLADLYPDLSLTEHWHENMLERMKNDKEHFGMEENEPMCRNSVPREGIVLRIDDDPVNEAFKLKCLKFLGKEAKEMDKGSTADQEMQERYNERG